MLKRRIILFASVILVTIISLLIMNRNYDPLARYAYHDDKTDQIILDNLNDREINYIIDYSISPDEFIGYIDAYDFNIYHLDYYKYADENLYSVTNKTDIVEICEKLLKKNVDFYDAIEEYRYYDSISIKNLIG